MKQAIATRGREPEAFLAWAVNAVQQMRIAAPDRPQLISNSDLQMLYVHALLRHFEDHCRVLINEVNRIVERSRADIAGLLRSMDAWDGEYRTLEDAMLLGYNGIANFDDLRRIHRDLKRNTPTLSAPLCDEFAELMDAAGLRAWWSGPMVLAAALRYVMMQDLLPAHLRRASLSKLWPGGSRTVETSLPAVSVRVTFDPSIESREKNTRALLQTIVVEQDRIEREFREAGYKPFLAREYERHVAWTFLRLRNPTRWGWRALTNLAAANKRTGKRYRDASSATAPSVSGVADAVGRVLALVEVQPPDVPRGRPSRR